MKLVRSKLRRTSVAAAVAAAVLASAPLETYAQDLEEIIVSARKKEESIQEVPVAVTAITAGMIQAMQIRDLDDIAKVTAGLTFDAEFNRTSNRPVIRGQANILGDSGVSYFIDGVYITGSINDYDINDIERIEVVKGPQSALYGRNTYSGAINIITRSPGDTWAARGRIEVTDDGGTEVNATVKGPVTDSFKVGITGRFYELDGAWTNTFDGSDIGLQESSSVSAVASFEPNDRFSARARVYFNDTKDGQPPLFAQDSTNNNCFEDNGSFYGGLGRYYCGTVAPAAINTDWQRQVPDARDNNETLQSSLMLDFGISDNLTLTSITGYNSVDSSFVIDGDYAPSSFQVANFAFFPYAFPSWGFIGSLVDFTFAGEDEVKDISQEFRLSWENERSSFLLGGYYFDQESKSRDVRELPGNAQALIDANLAAENASLQAFLDNVACTAFPCTNVGPIAFDPTIPGLGPTTLNLAVPRDTLDVDIRNVALFGLAAFDLTEATRLTVEGRWAEEKVDRIATIQDLGGPAGTPSSASATFDSFNARITLDHQVSDNHLIYALFAQGNKPGGFNGTVAIEAGLPTYDEEEVDSFEVGSKNTAFDGQLVANFAGFFNQIDGYQLTQNARAGANTTSATVNAGDAEILGFEAELQYRPASVEGLRLMFNYAYTDAEFVSGEDENLGVLLDVAVNGEVDCSLGDQFPDPNDPNSCNASKFGDINGKRIPRTAKHQMFVDAEIRQPFGGGNWDWYLGANYSYESSKFAQVTNFAETGDAKLLGVRLGLVSDRYSISVWGKNLGGEDSSPLVLRYADGNDAFKRSFVGTQRRDTYWGLTAIANFN